MRINCTWERQYVECKDKGKKVALRFKKEKRTFWSKICKKETKKERKDRNKEKQKIIEEDLPKMMKEEETDEWKDGC